MRSRARSASLRLDIADPTSTMDPDGGPVRAVPLDSRRKWRNKVAWMVTLCVLLGVLVWVGRGGLDIQPSSPSAPVDFQQQETTPQVVALDTEVVDGERTQAERTLEPLDPAEAETQAEDFDGEVGIVLKKSAKTKGLNDAEIEEARLAATNTVKEALRKPGGLPPPYTEAMFSETCSLQVEGLPLYQSEGQRCCKASQKLPRPQQHPGAGGATADNASSDAAPQGRRVLTGEGGENALPGVLRTQRTGAVGTQEVSCFPSFIIAGTQKSGTTALAGILEQHPQVMMSERKELHFFDHTSPNKKTAENYAGNFARFNASQAMENRAPFVVGEATPFYLASRNACKNMRKLVPDVRLVVLVREPVKRAYSEHQMKVRRVEEQGEMLELLPLHAKQVYDCAVKILPSPDANNLSDEELEFVAFPPSLSAAIGECAGEVGQHGKWTDTMIPFARRVKAKFSRRETSRDKSTKGAKPTHPADAMEGFREDFSRCFPLKTVVDEMEKLHPDGSWKQGWSRRSAPKGPGGGLPGAPNGPSPSKGGGNHGLPGFLGAHPKKGRGKLGAGQGPQHRKLHQEQDWIADDLFLDDGDRLEYYRNTTAEAEAEAAGAGTGAATGSSVADDEFFGPYGDAAGGRWGDSWGSAAGRHAEEYAAAGWRGNGDGLEERLIDSAYYGYWSGKGEFPTEGGAFSVEEGEFDGDAAAVIRGRRELQSKKGAVSTGTPWAEVWGAWGMEGERTFDDTCYQRRETVIPAGQIMRAEMTKLRKCFNGALSDLGGLDALGEAASVAAAEAIDSKLSKCFTPSAGISDQYIYRSLYGVQAYHCLKHVPRDQVMFIESDELRDKPEEVMPRIHEHIGVPGYQYRSLDQAAIFAELSKKYPDFEKKTGWRFESAYKEEIPEALAKEIRDFTAPHMKMFARLTGQSFGDWAVDDRHKEEAMVGGLERPTELFEEEFEKEATRIARAKGGHGGGGAREAVGAAAGDNRISNPVPDSAGTGARGDGAEKAAPP